MPERSRSKPEPKRAPAEFGRAAIDLAATIGKTRQDLARATGRTTTATRSKTIDRLAQGEGSLAAAIDVRNALAAWGLDVSKLPPIDEVPLVVNEQPLADWKREWMDLGETLHRLAAPERFRAEVLRIRRLVEAHQVVAGEIPDAPHR